MTILPWGTVAIAALSIASIGCTADKFSACDGCDDSGTTGGTAGAAGSGGSSGSSGSSGSAGSAGMRDAGGRGGSGGTGGSSGSGAQGGEGFPRTTVLDDFNRADGPPGSNWLGNTSSFRVMGGRLSYTSGICAATLWQAVFGAEQEVFATLASFNPDAAEINVVLKAQERSDCELLEVLYSAADRRLELHYCSEGQWHTIAGIPLTLNPGDRLGARFYTADNNVHVFVNGVRATIFDASEFPHNGRGGRIGVNCEADPDGTTAWDDFGGG